MNDDRAERIRELRILAQEFREKAEATSLREYIELMMQTAQDLTRFADALERVPDHAITEPPREDCAA